MSRVGREDDRDEKCLKLLVEHGVQTEHARHVLNSIKQTFDIAAAPDDPSAQPSKAAFQFRRTTRKRANKNHFVAGAPFEEFKAYADQHQWSQRTSDKYNQRLGVFLFINDVYGEWMKRGEAAGMPLAQADIKAVDPKLYDRMHGAGTQYGKPDWFHLPSASEAALVGLDPEELQMRLASRELTTRTRNLRTARSKDGMRHE